MMHVLYDDMYTGPAEVLKLQMQALFIVNHMTLGHIP